MRFRQLPDVKLDSGKVELAETDLEYSIDVSCSTLNTYIHTVIHT